MMNRYKFHNNSGKTIMTLPRLAIIFFSPLCFFGSAGAGTVQDSQVVTELNLPDHVKIPLTIKYPTNLCSTIRQRTNSLNISNCVSGELPFPSQLISHSYPGHGMLGQSSFRIGYVLFPRSDTPNEYLLWVKSQGGYSQPGGGNTYHTACSTFMNCTNADGFFGITVNVGVDVKTQNAQPVRRVDGYPKSDDMTYTKTDTITRGWKIGATLTGGVGSSPTTGGGLAPTPSAQLAISGEYSQQDSTAITRTIKATRVLARNNQWNNASGRGTAWNFDGSFSMQMLPSWEHIRETWKSRTGDIQIGTFAEYPAASTMEPEIDAVFEIQGYQGDRMDIVVTYDVYPLIGNMYGGTPLFRNGELACDSPGEFIRFTGATTHMGGGSIDLVNEFKNYGCLDDDNRSIELQYVTLTLPIGLATARDVNKPDGGNISAHIQQQISNLQRLIQQYEQAYRTSGNAVFQQQANNFRTQLQNLQAQYGGGSVQSQPPSQPQQPQQPGGGNVPAHIQQQMSELQHLIQQNEQAYRTSGNAVFQQQANNFRTQLQNLQTQYRY